MAAQQAEPDERSQDEVTAEWQDAHLPSVFARWHRHLEPAQAETVRAIIEAAGVEPGFAVLDIGCGSGIPSLELARVVGPAGSVMATDPSPVSVAAVEENARALGLTNLTAVQAPAASLPFPPASFDAATCHFGVMFFPDVLAGLGRIRTVLRPGRRAAFVAWGPEAENTLFGSFFSAAGPYLPEPDGPPAEPAGETSFGEPGPMRFARPGTLGRALTAAGFADVREESRSFRLAWPGSVESLKAFWFDMTRLPERLPADRLADLDRDVGAALGRFAGGDAIAFTATIVVASGRA